MKTTLFRSIFFIFLLSLGSIRSNGAAGDVCSVNGIKGFCPRYYLSSYRCWNDDDVELRLTFNATYTDGDCLKVADYCCYPKSGEDWLGDEGSCLGWEGCALTSSCEETYTGIFNHCSVGAVCCDEKSDYTVEHGGVCKIGGYDGICVSSAYSGYCGESTRANCSDENDICCPNYYIPECDSGSCVSDSSSMSGCLSPAPYPTKCIYGENKDCCLSIPTCDSEDVGGACVGSNLSCQFPNEVDNSFSCPEALDGSAQACCVSSSLKKICEPSFGYCTKSLCQEITYSEFGWEDCGAGEVCCSDKTVCAPDVCLALSSSCPDGTTPVSASDCSGKCCRPLNAPTSKTGNPKELVYRGPVIDTLEKIFSPVAQILYYGGLFIGVCFIIFSGYKLMVSQGNPQKTQDAQEQLTAAVFGIGFILLSAVILRIIIKSILGVEEINI